MRPASARTDRAAVVKPVGLRARQELLDKDHPVTDLGDQLSCRRRISAQSQHFGDGEWACFHIRRQAVWSPLEDGAVMVGPAPIGGTDLSARARSVQGQADTGPGVKGVDRPGGVGPLSTCPAL
ncbi:hypothetical protein ACIOEW_31375 [Streptomyces sp. NPDC087901]|uniref:hypothetical protein n=1 Tax=Streptomyces sp. NPDC087901 TaxID=3365818 RepID=UPI0037F6D5DD